ncbi:MAG TPA: 5'-nucleotidase C-terminal domain-containing protein, partial [Mesotoga infera]|nr:5'-nucleotidase C-terminal domain-containing protein [Mesotoga infera]
MYRPYEAITGVEFGQAIARVVFGVDEEIDYGAKLAELVYAPAELLSLKRPLRREEAAQILSNFVDNPNFQVITILATADIHGHIEPYTPSGAKYPIGAMEKMAYYVSTERAIQPDLLLLDVGDAPYNTNVANLFEGEPVIKIMNMMGYDAMAIGNHDFDFPFNVMERNSKLANFPFLSANTLYMEKPVEFLKEYVMKEIGGLKIAIVGLTDDSSAWYTHPRNVAGITFEEQYSAAQRVLDEVAPQADLVIALAHLHTGNRILPEKVPGYDLIFEGGRDVVAFPEKINGSWVISSGKHGELISKTNLNIFNNEVIGINFAHIFMSQNLPQDEAVVELVNGYVAQLDEKMNTVIGRTEVDLDGERGTVRLKESNLANAIADSLREMTGTDFAIQNGGGVRASIPKGDITIKDVYTVL